MSVSSRGWDRGLLKWIYVLLPSLPLTTFVLHYFPRSSVIQGHNKVTLNRRNSAVYKCKTQSIGRAKLPLHPLQWASPGLLRFCYPQGSLSLCIPPSSASLSLGHLPLGVFPPYLHFMSLCTHVIFHSYKKAHLNDTLLTWLLQSPCFQIRSYKEPVLRVRTPTWLSEDTIQPMNDAE